MFQDKEYAMLVKATSLAVVHTRVMVSSTPASLVMSPVTLLMIKWYLLTYLLTLYFSPFLNKQLSGISPSEITSLRENLPVRNSCGVVRVHWVG